MNPISRQTNTYNKYMQKPKSKVDSFKQNDTQIQYNTSSMNFFSSLLHLVGVAVVYISTSSTALGQEAESRQLRKDVNKKIFSGVTITDEKGAVLAVDDQRVILRDRYTALQERGRQSLVWDEWMDEIDSQMKALETWILSKEKEKPCTWGDAVLGETLDWGLDNNIAFPSFDSNYWITSIKIEDLASSTIKINGMPPNARYYSFQTYTLNDVYTSVVGAIADVNIKLKADGSFEILINNGEETGDPQVNSLKGLPNGAKAGTIILIYRTYLPVPLTSPSGGVSLPLISIQMGGDDDLVDLEYCEESDPIIDIEDPTEYKTKVQFPRLPSEGIEYFRTTGRFTPFPNDDIAYLATDSLIFPVKDYAVVARGKAPTFSNGIDPNPQVRYWSMCKLSLPSTKTESCLSDEDAILDSQGRYVIVVAPERPLGSGFDYLNFGPGPIGVLALRNILPSPEFYEMSVQNVYNADEDVDIRTKMGEFYPDTVYCSIATIEEQGVDACFFLSE